MTSSLWVEGLPAALLQQSCPGIHNFFVLLLEAGGKTPIGMTANMGLNSIPGLAPDNVLSKNLDWGIRQEPQSDGRILSCNRGKVLGGCHELNFCLTVAGAPGDYDDWAEAVGSDGWSWSNMSKHLQYFDSIMCSRPTNADDPFVQATMAACKSLGHKEVSDPQLCSQLGAAYAHWTVDEKGMRNNTFRAFLKPAMPRANLTVLTNAQVAKVVLQTSQDDHPCYLESTSAVGVQLIDGRIFNASKEVVLCAGAYLSPHLLSLSGIGPSELLSKAGIQGKVDLPGVGSNLQDHPAVSYPCSGKAGCGVTASTILAPGTLEKFLSKGRGPMSVSGMSLTLLMASEKKYEARPDMQMLMLPVGPTSKSCGLISGSHVEGPKKVYQEWLAGYDKKARAQTPEFLPAPLDGLPLANGVFFVVPLNQPETRGSVVTISKDPTQQPKITFEPFGNENDMKRMVLAARKVAEIAGQEELAQFGVEVLYHNELCDKHGPDTDEYWQAYIRSFGHLMWHPTGTCKMGKASDEAAVVDDRLRVHKVANLRVADASIMPSITSVNTNTPTAAIALRLVELLRQDHSEIERV